MATAETVTSAADAMGAAAANGAEKVRESMDKAAKGFEKLGEFNKANFEAFVASAGVSTKAMEKLGAEMASYAKTASEGFSEAAKSIFGAKTLQAAMEAHSDYVKSSFDSYVAELGKINEMMSAATKEAFEPLKARAKAFTELFPAAA